MPPALLPRLRRLNITLRGWHPIGVAGLAGGYLSDLPEARCWPPSTYRPTPAGCDS